MKQVVGLFIITIAIIVFAGWVTKDDNLTLLLRGLPTNLFSANNFQPKIQETGNKQTINIGGHSFQVEIADTQEKRRIGLTKYKNLPENYGMLFVFKKPARPAFWMKDMNFPIDIIWIADNRVVQITTSVPTVLDNTPNEQIPTYSPTQPVNYVLEIMAGEVKKKKIKVGDKVRIPNL